jgi:hypothetical protein
VLPPMSALAKGRLRELALVALCYAALAICFTYPLAFRLGNLARTDNADGQFAIWNVAWVARALGSDPLGVFDANIFHPQRRTLAYSEANLGAGLLAAPVYWVTGNPVAAFNSALLLSFVLGGVSVYCLVRYLAHDRRAAFVAGTCFAFCPYLFGHIPHIQLLMTAGLPLALLAFHRVADVPTAGRGVLLGLTITAQALLCAYYGVMAMLVIGYAVVFTCFSRANWTNRAYWSAIAIAAAVAILTTLPVALPYILLQSETGFNRSLDGARDYSAHWRMFLASGSFLHAPMMKIVGQSGELLFPGLIATGFGVAGAAAGWSRGGRARELAVFYVSLAALAVWVSIGPDGGLYRALYSAVPGFTFMRAPSRFGLLVVLSLSILAGTGIARLLARRSHASWIALVLSAFTVAELLVPLRLTPVPPVERVYQVLATQPRGAVLDLPVYSHPFRFLRARYQLGSTAHWMPIVVAYSDYIPPEFVDNTSELASFPSLPAFKQLERDRVRYVVFHLNEYKSPEALLTLDRHLKEFAPYLRSLHRDDRALL